MEKFENGLIFALTWDSRTQNAYLFSPFLPTPQTLSAGAVQAIWPTWVDHLTVLSHLLLAFNSSVNLALYCACDRHIGVIAQKKLKMIFVWPITLR